MRAIRLGRGAGRHRLLFVLLVGLAVSMAGPSSAQRFIDLARQGPFAWLRGIVFRQAVGPLTGGDWVDLAPADWDRDGRLDLFVGSGYGDLLFFRQRADGLFEPPSGLGSAESNPFAFDPVRSQACPETCDWDADGDLDLLLATGTKVYLYEARTTETGTAFAPGVELLAEGATTLLPSADCLISAVSSAGARPDLFISSPDGRLLLARRKADTFLAPPEVVLPAGDLPRARADVADFDGDGTVDLIIGTADGRAFYRPGQAGDRLAFGEPLPLGPEGGRLPTPDGAPLQDLSPRCVDWDGDGDMDLLLGTRSGRVLRLERTEAARLEVRAFLQQEDAPIDPGRCVAADLGDWNGDGRDDLIVGAEDGLLRVYPDEGRARDGVFGAELIVRQHGAPYRREGGYPQPAFVPHTGEQLPLLALGGGDGAFQLLSHSDRAIVHAEHLSAGGRPVALAGLTTVSVCDYDLDGDSDLFLGAGELPGQPIGPAQPVIYLENQSKRNALPQFTKAAQVELYTSGPQGDTPLQEAGALRPKAVSVIEWTPGGNPEFAVASAQGVDLFTTPMLRNVYPTLFLAPGEGSRLLPPVYFARATLFLGHTGILVGTEAYGLLCWYPRAAWEELDATG